MTFKKLSSMMAVMVAAFSLAGCSSDELPNNLGNVTRDNNDAYRYNYDFSGTDTRGNYGAGPGYWDYYGITNGSANDTVTGQYDGYNSSAYGSPSNDAAVAKTVDIDSARLAD